MNPINIIGFIRDKNRVDHVWSEKTKVNLRSVWFNFCG